MYTCITCVMPLFNVLFFVFFKIKSEFSKKKKVKKMIIYCFCSSANVHHLYQAKMSAI